MVQYRLTNEAAAKRSKRFANYVFVVIENKYFDCLGERREMLICRYTNPNAKKGKTYQGPFFGYELERIEE